MLKILVIEDDDVAAFAVQKIIQKLWENPAYLRANTLTGGENILQEQGVTINAVLLDLGLPDTENPLDTYNRMKKWADKIPIIIMTSLNDHALAKSLIHGGAEDYLYKELMAGDPKHIRDAIEFAIERRALYQKMSSDKEKAEKDLRQEENILKCFMGGYSVSTPEP